MAKKVVATLKTGTGKQFTKCIKMVKSFTTAPSRAEGQKRSLATLPISSMHAACVF